MLLKLKKNKIKLFDKLKNIGLSLASVFVSFLILESVLRITHQVPQIYLPRGLFIEDENLGFKLKPNFKGTVNLGEFSYEIAVNSKGLRDKERSADTAFRILGIGDSFIFGIGLELEQTYLYALEKMINSKSVTNCEVINAGCPAYGTKQELEYLKLSGLAYKPKIILLGFCLSNDVYDNFSDYERVNSGFLVLPKSENKKNISFFNIKSFCRMHFYSYSYIVNKIKNIPSFRRLIFRSGLSNDNLREELKLYREIYDQQTNYAWNKTFDLIKEMKGLADNEGIRFCVIIIPGQIHVDADYKRLINKQYGLNEEDYDTSKPARLLEDFCKKSMVDCLNLLPLFKRKIANGRHLYYLIDGHWNNEGALLAAKRTFSYLEKKGYFNEILNY